MNQTPIWRLKSVGKLKPLNERTQDGARGIRWACRKDRLHRDWQVGRDSATPLGRTRQLELHGVAAVMPQLVIRFSQFVVVAIMFDSLFSIDQLAHHWSGNNSRQRKLIVDRSHANYVCYFAQRLMRVRSKVYDFHCHPLHVVTIFVPWQSKGNPYT